jgi:hypothetical protein
MFTGSVSSCPRHRSLSPAVIRNLYFPDLHPLPISASRLGVQHRYDRIYPLHFADRIREAQEEGAWID